MTSTASKISILHFLDLIIAHAQLVLVQYLFTLLNAPVYYHSKDYLLFCSTYLMASQICTLAGSNVTPNIPAFSYGIKDKFTCGFEPVYKCVYFQCIAVS